MIHYLIQSLNNIGSISLIEENGIYLFTVDSKLCKYDNLNNLVWMTPELETQWLSFSNKNYILPFHQYQLLRKVSKKTGEVTDSLEMDIFPVQINDDEIWFEKGMGDEVIISTFNIQTNTIKDYCSLSDGRLKAVFKSESFLKFSNGLVCQSLIDGEILWRYGLEQLLGVNTQIQSDVIVIKDRLIFYASSEKQSATFCLNRKTGNVIEKIDNFGGNFIKFNNQLYCVRYPNQVQILDPVTLKSKSIDYISVLKRQKLQIWPNKFVVQDNEFYFVQNIGENFSRVGILDLNNNNLKWVYNFKPKNGQVVDIQVYDSVLYVLTRDNTFHVFEKRND